MPDHTFSRSATPVSGTFAASVVFAVAVAALLAGCGGAEPTALSDRDFAHMKVVGVLYRECMEAKNGAPPASKEEFIQYLKRDPANWDKLASTPEEFLTSPRDGQPLTMRFGAAAKEPPGGGFPWVAREQTGDGGKVLVVNTGGAVESLEQSEADKIFPPSS